LVTETKQKPKYNPIKNLPGPGPGRPKGSKDKIPRDIRNRVLDVWDQLEKEKKGLMETARKDPQWFFSTMVKPILPKDVKVESEGGITIKIVRFSDDGNDTAR
jgi:hypothetical protein